MAQFLVDSKEALYDSLEQYAGERREEIDKRDLGRDTGLIKSYLLETARHDGAPDIPGALARTELRAERLGDGDAFALFRGQQQLGYVEALGTRHLAIHSYMQNVRQIDDIVRRLAERTPNLDAIWLAGATFQQLLQRVIAPLNPRRNTIVKFEYVPAFATARALAVDEREDALIWATSPAPADAAEDDDVDPDQRSASLMERAARLAATLSDYQRINPTWRAIRALRIPGAEHGGYDLYSWGKLTHRTSSFRGGHAWLREIVGIYERATRAIEETVWLDAEPLHTSAGGAAGLRGLPVVASFPEPLPDHVFRNFVSLTFERGEGPFRLWGEPIRLGERKVHVYGLDLHLWQPISMELTPRQFVFLLPRGTCGNTVHRLMTNLQRYVDPAVELRIGERDYGDLMLDAILPREGRDV